jgi:hypothetical protein
MFVVVIDGKSRRLATETDRDALQARHLELATKEQEAAERAWYASLRSLGLRLGDEPGEGEALNVVGESHYLEALAGLMARLRVDRRDREVMSVGRLTREPSNPYDGNAVRVDVQGRQVGYLSREDAADIQGWLQAAARAWPVFVLARLGGGVEIDGQVGPIGVTLEELPAVFG